MPGAPHASVELRQFRYFVAVAEERHFGRAALRLRIAQPGLSQQIKRLERSIGVDLFERTPRGVELTAAGSGFLDEARLVLETAERAVTSVILAAGGKKGILRLGTPALAMPPAAEHVLQAFVDRFPDVELETHPGLQPDLVDAISSHSLDVAIVGFPFKAVEPPPQYLPLGAYEIMVALPEGHRLAELERVPRSELLNERFLSWPRSLNPELIEHLYREVFGVSEHPQVLEIAELQQDRRLAYVAEGRGFGVTAFRPGMEGRAPGVVFRRLEDPIPLIGYGVAWAATHSSPFVDAFLDIAREFAGSELTSDSDREALLLNRDASGIEVEQRPVRPGGKVA
jgi:DNA-binding transcriptional LysR family regulator